MGVCLQPSIHNLIMMKPAVNKLDCEYSLSLCFAGLCGFIGVWALMDYSLMGFWPWPYWQHPLYHRCHHHSPVQSPQCFRHFHSGHRRPIPGKPNSGSAAWARAELPRYCWNSLPVPTHGPLPTSCRGGHPPCLHIPVSLLPLRGTGVQPPRDTVATTMPRATMASPSLLKTLFYTRYSLKWLYTLQLIVNLFIDLSLFFWKTNKQNNKYCKISLLSVCCFNKNLFIFLSPHSSVFCCCVFLFYLMSVSTSFFISSHPLYSIFPFFLFFFSSALLSFFSAFIYSSSSYKGFYFLSNSLFSFSVLWGFFY